ncbi:hybrid sensor histidine kinase/response regulator [Thalassoroseus pseudoceratinae]|uniref:hybrid sensor histidine kinase/response regulator n=1 Tax=Thalassoroseus pseudoceratinae TaxID=2713176 RepID=UPI001422CD27|nr:ATP-binding protein [Thalassoroseus pseudoceratinae]
MRHLQPEDRALDPLNFQKLFESAPGLYLVLTTEFRIAAASDAYLQATMTQRESIIGRGIFEVFPDNPDDPTATGVKNLRASLEKVLQSGASDALAVQKYDIRRPETDGGGFEERYWSPVNSPVLGSDGNVEHIIHRVEDVTEFIQLKQRRLEQEKDYEDLRLRSETMEAEVFLRAQEIQEANRKLKETNKELQLAHERLSEADRRKDEFLAMLAHELRNPLAPIRSGLDLLSMHSASQPDAIELMQEQVEHVVRLVDDLLDMSRIMTGKIELRREAVELSAIVKRSVDAVQPLIEAHQQTLSVSCPERSIWLDADPVRLLQIVENLLNNASKYTGNGGKIELSAEPKDGQAFIRVRDTGIGIEPELLPRIFDLFTQSTRTLDRSQGGLGIGLTLVQRLVRLHGGEISVESKGVGQGSEFVVKLPIIAPPVQPGGVVQSHPLQTPQRILVVEDNKGAANMLSKLLTKLDDHEVDLAHDGRTGLEKIKSTKPDVVLLDIGLPGLDGYQVASDVRQDEEFDEVLLVALTGYGQQEDRQKSQEVGFDLHLVKPPSIDQIRTVLAHPKLMSAKTVETALDSTEANDSLSHGVADQPAPTAQREGTSDEHVSPSPAGQIKHDILNAVNVLTLMVQILGSSQLDKESLQIAKEGLKKEADKLRRIANSLLE